MSLHNYTVRAALRTLNKPTIIKSLINGHYYCGFGLTQSEKYVAAYYRTPNFPASRYVTCIGKGETPAEAFRAWESKFKWLNRFAE